MKIRDVVARSGRNLRSAKIRTILTALAIGVGGFTLTITLAAGNGLRNYTDKLVASNFDPAEMIVGRDVEISNNGAPKSEPKEYDESVSSLNLGGGGQGNLQIKRVTQKDIEEIKKQPDIESVRESFQINLRYVTRDGQKKYTGGAEVYSTAQKPELEAGSLPNGKDLEAGKALLPNGYISVLGFKNANDAIGKSIQLTVAKSFTQADVQSLVSNLQQGNVPTQPPSPEQKTVTLKIAGITKKPTTSFAVGQQPILLGTQDGKDLYDFTTQGTTDYEKYVYVYARVKDANDANLLAAKQNLEAKGFYVQTSKDIQKAITQFVNILQIMVGVFGIITLIASVFGIINTQYISVLERTREIGLMKALGMRSRDVRRLFMIEATWIGFLGGAIGSLAGYLTGTLLNPLISDKLNFDAQNRIFIFDPLQIVLMILALMVVATIAGLLPAWKASRLDPIVALRRE